MKDEREKQEPVKTQKGDERRMERKNKDHGRGGTDRRRWRMETKHKSMDKQAGVQQVEGRVRGGAGGKGSYR